jgi:hypothetical protein
VCTGLSGVHRTVRCALCQVRPSWPRGRISPHRNPRAQGSRVEFYWRTGLSGVPSAQRLAVRTSRWSRPLAHRWRTGLSGVPMRRTLPITASWWVRAIYTPSTHHIQCLAAHINSCTLVEHCKHQKASEEIRES